MAQIPGLLMRLGAAVLFAWAFAVQAGVPAPAMAPDRVGVEPISTVASSHLKDSLLPR